MTGESDLNFDASRLTAIYDDAHREQLYIATREDVISYAAEVNTEKLVASIAFGSLCRATLEHGHLHVARGPAIDITPRVTQSGLRVTSFPYLLDLIERKENGEKTGLKAFSPEASALFKDFVRAVLL